MRDRSSSVKGHPVDEVPSAGTNVLFEMWLASRAVTGLLDAALARTGLTADEFGIYSVLTSAETVTPTELARWMAAPPTTVSSHIKRFEERGHVVRDRNPSDGRSYCIRLTPSGRQAHAVAVKAFGPALDAIVAELGTRERSVRRALATLREAVEATNTRPTDGRGVSGVDG